jgi:hypothetical protein
MFTHHIPSRIPVFLSYCLRVLCPTTGKFSMEIVNFVSSGLIEVRGKVIPEYHTMKTYPVLKHHTMKTEGEVEV